MKVFFCFKIIFCIFFIHIPENFSKRGTMIFTSLLYKLLIHTNFELLIPSVVREIKKSVYKTLLDTLLTIHKKGSI